MDRKRHSRATSGLILFWLLVLSADAYAYLDPGTGSLLYQTMLAALLGAGFVFRRVWMWIGKALLGLIHQRPRGGSKDAPGAP